MDEAHYANWMPQVSSFFEGLQAEFVKYLNAGRLTLLKALLNLLKFKYLPLSPALFRWICFTQLLAVAFWSMKALVPPASSVKTLTFRFDLFLLTVGILLLQRPTWDVVALVAIPEQYVLVFLSLGALLFFRGNSLYRVCFTFAVLNKEPSVVAFFASAAVWAFGSKRNFRSAAIDVLIGLFWVVTARKLMLAGTYFGDHYQLLSFATVQNGLRALTKVAIGTLPLIFLVRRRIEPDELNRALFFFVLGAGYLFLVIAYASAGYLLIPAAWAIQMGVLSLVGLPKISNAENRPEWKIRLATILFLMVAIVTFYRYQRFVHSFNDSTRYLEALTLRKEPLLILTYAPEVPPAIQIYSRQANTDVRSKNPSELTADDREKIVNRQLDLYFIEFVTYDGPLSPEQRNSLQQLVDHWDDIEDHNTYRVYIRNAQNTPK